MLPVTKYHGCGNDFIILREEDAVGYDLNTLIPAVCDRHTGLGADGLILVRVRPLTMLFYNCDGSRAPMCGNGIRCFAKFCLDEGIIDAKQFDVETLAGIKTVTITSRDPFFAQVAMGQADFSPEAVGVSQSGPVLDFPVSVEGKTVLVDSFFMSTVHTVWFVENPGGSRNPADRGTYLRKPAVPGKDQRQYGAGAGPADHFDAHLGAGRRHDAGLRHRGLCGGAGCVPQRILRKRSGNTVAQGPPRHPDRPRWRRVDERPCRTDYKRSV